MTEHPPQVPAIGRRAFLAGAVAAGAAAGAAALPDQDALAARVLRSARAAGAGVTARGNRYALQKAFVDRRFGMFIHFNMGTFHDMEWVDPNQDPLTFNPTNLDCGQWADAAKAAGMTFAVLTVKHHDGFCLWPSDLTTYDVMSSSYRHDIVREYVGAFRSRGVTPCLYFSIWDRTNGVAGPDGTAPVTRAQIDFVKGQLTELLTRYGRIPLLIFDGWAWQMGHRQVPFGEIRTHVEMLQPDCLIMDLNGLTVPWDSDLLFVEEPKGGVFCPPGNTYAASQGQTISPAGWFWHPATPGAVLTPDQIVDGHLKVLEPRYCTFILNCPPNPQGLLDQSIVGSLHGAGALWSPDRSRPPLPPQPDVITYPVTAVSAAAADGNAAAAVDGHSDFGWNGEADQTLWAPAGPLHQAITLDLGRVYTGLDTLSYLPRQDTATPWSFSSFVTDGNITAYRVLLSEDGQRFEEAAHGTWAADHTRKQARFRPARARYVRLEALAAVGGTAMASEIGAGGTRTPPRALGQ